ncbi:MAG: hypothetical protein PHH85_03875 [Candidatus Methanoperedens sp.]|nr:hypothetical protein [Candidatus Methanoperedens sp.]
MNLKIQPIGVIKKSSSGLSELITRKGNLLTVRGIEADDDSLIDVRLKK